MFVSIIVRPANNIYTYSALYSQLRSDHFRSDQHEIHIESHLGPPCQMAATLVQFQQI